jgi:hypothetical protein
MNQQANDRNLLIYAMKKIRHLQEHIQICQIQLEHYNDQRDNLLAKIVAQDQDAHDLMIENLEEVQR